MENYKIELIKEIGCYSNAIYSTRDFIQIQNVTFQSKRNLIN